MSSDWIRHANRVKAIYQEVQDLARKRKGVVDIVYTLSMQLEQTPLDETLRKKLENELRYEEEIIERLRRAVDDYKVELKSMIRPINRQIPPSEINPANPKAAVEEKREILDMLENSIDTLRFVERHLDRLASRVEKGKRIVHKGKADWFRRYQEEVAEEEKIDEEIAARLEGRLARVTPLVEKLKRQKGAGMIHGTFGSFLTALVPGLFVTSQHSPSMLLTASVASGLVGFIYFFFFGLRREERKIIREEHQIRKA